MNRRLSILKGLPLQTFFRASNMLEIGFGDIVKEKNLRKEIVDVAQYRIHVQCPWRFVLGKKIIVASEDIYLPCSTIKWSDDFDWDVFGNNLFDELCEQEMYKLLQKIFVEDVILEQFGGLSIVFSSRYMLQILPVTSNNESELWRFFKSGAKHHFVRYIDRIEKE
ncbi:MAG: hypothetical protein LBR68_06785 [Lachnoclostridium sp.]|jgi:hypothetical protein|nr:hypothetical protein [Lachnoclostridium sp.]